MPPLRSSPSAFGVLILDASPLTHLSPHHNPVPKMVDVALLLGLFFVVYSSESRQLSEAPWYPRTPNMPLPSRGAPLIFPPPAALFFFEVIGVELLSEVMDQACWKVENWESPEMPYPEVPVWLPPEMEKERPAYCSGPLASDYPRRDITGAGRVCDPGYFCARFVPQLYGYANYSKTLEGVWGRGTAGAGFWRIAFLARSLLRVAFQRPDLHAPFPPLLQIISAWASSARCTTSRQKAGPMVN